MVVELDEEGRREKEVDVEADVHPVQTEGEERRMRVWRVRPRRKASLPPSLALMIKNDSSESSSARGAKQGKVT